VKARRRAWQHREITLEPEAWTRLAPAVAAADPDEAEQASAHRRRDPGVLEPAEERASLLALAQRER
jgi:hypothetical protein